MEASLRVHGRLSLRLVLALAGVELFASRLGVRRGDAKPDLYEFRHAARYIIVGAPQAVIGLLLRWGVCGAMSATLG